jgi:hypothetical protein
MSFEAVWRWWRPFCVKYFRPATIVCPKPRIMKYVWIFLPVLIREISLPCRVGRKKLIKKWKKCFLLKNSTNLYIYCSGTPDSHNFRPFKLVTLAFHPTHTRDITGSVRPSLISLRTRGTPRLATDSLELMD